MFNIGDVLKNGAKVLAYRNSNNDKRIVLAHWEDNKYHPYVTWRVDAKGNTFLGHYFANIVAASADYAGR